MAENEPTSELLEGFGKQHMELRLLIEDGSDTTLETFNNFIRTGVESNFFFLKRFNPVDNPQNPHIVAAANRLAVFIGIRADNSGKKAINYCHSQIVLLRDEIASLSGILNIPEEEIEKQVKLPFEDQSPQMQSITPKWEKAGNWKKMRQVLIDQYVIEND